jgi:hypothetical protein
VFAERAMSSSARNTLTAAFFLPLLSNYLGAQPPRAFAPSPRILEAGRAGKQSVAMGRSQKRLARVYLSPTPLNLV